MNKQLVEAAEKHVELQYPMGVEKEYPIMDFIAGAEWQQKQNRAAEIDPIPAWFGLIPVDPAVEQSVKH